MIPEDKHIDEPIQSPEEKNDIKKHSPLRRIFKITGLSIASIFFLIILLTAGATWWLTPDRLTRLVNREASENLYADVEAHNIRFTLWSTWPHLCIEFDSLNVRSRVFDSIPTSMRAQLPQNADFLLSTGKFRGGINILSLLKREISLQDVELGGLILNLVSLNDSLSNFNIVSSDTTTSRIPYFTSNQVKLLNTGVIDYQSLADSAKAKVALSALALTREPEKKKGREKGDSYRLKLLGNVNAKVADLTILHGFPFELGGNIILGFDPFRVATSDYNVNLGTLHSNIDMKMQVGGESRLDDFRWHLDNFDLLRLLSYIPGVNPQDFGNFNAPVTVNATARLTSPWRLSSSVLPSAEVDFDIVDGDMSYTLPNGDNIQLRHEGAGARLIFDGVNPAASSFIVPQFNVSGDGVDMAMQASITDLLGNPEVEASFDGYAVLNQMGPVFPFLNNYALKGDAEALATARCTLAPLSEITSAETPIRDIDVDGKVVLSDFSASMPGNKGKVSGKKLEMDFALPDSSFLFSKELLPFALKGEKISFNIPSKSLSLSLKDMTLTGAIPEEAIANGDLKGSDMGVKFESSNLRMVSGKDHMSLNDISLDFSAKKTTRTKKIKDYVMPQIWTADHESQKSIPHSDPFIQVKLDEKWRNIMATWQPYVRLKVKSGVITTPDFPAANHLYNLDMEASFDSVVVRNVSMRSRASAMAMRGSVTNLRQFLNSNTPAPLYVNMEVAIDTIQVNQLAGTYMRGRGKQDMAKFPDKNDSTANAVTPSDMIAMLLPRNIVANIHATAKQSQYMNLHLYDLATGLKLRDGNMDVENLRISADFGHAFLNFGFNTSDIENIGMNADMSVSDINLVRFFQNFHTLLLMMPQMKNLDGNISAEMQLDLLAFPNMYVNIPSIAADIRVQGDDLTVHQSKFIRHITKMLLIRENGDLHIADMNVHASIHDNLLELYPFNFIVDNYRLRMGGLNNFDGDLYYHIGVDKSPIPFPFGINIVGNIDHPKIRFGGAHWKIKKGEEITASVMEEHRLNIVAEGKKFLKEFIRKAAEADNQ